MQRLQRPNDSIIFPTTGQKNLFLQFNNNGLALEDFNRCFSQIWFAKFNLRYPRSSESRGVSSSKERAGLIYGKNQLSFWSLNNLLSLLFIRARAQHRRKTNINEHSYKDNERKYVQCLLNAPYVHEIILWYVFSVSLQPLAWKVWQMLCLDRSFSSDQTSITFE